VSYSSNRFEAGRRTGNYTGRILKGAKPAELPIMLPTQFQMVINLGPPRRSASTCRQRFSPAPTK